MRSLNPPPVAVVRFLEQTVTRSSFGDRFVMPSMAELRTRVLAGAGAALGTVASVVVVVAGKLRVQPLAIYRWYDHRSRNRNLDLRRRTNRSSMSETTPTMSAVTLCPPSISDGAIKMRIVKSLLRKFRGAAWPKIAPPWHCPG